jgi:uncharacterized protein (TIGR02118 family)
MVKLICFVRRKPGMSPEEFHRYWREVHAEKVKSTKSGSYAVRYEQNHRPLDDYERPFASDHDGVTIQWYRSMEEFDASVAAPDYADLHADMERFIDTSSLVWIMTEEPEIVIDGPTST